MINEINNIIYVDDNKNDVDNSNNKINNDIIIIKYEQYLRARPSCAYNARTLISNPLLRKG
jgi:hypothetical protein